MSGTPRLEFNKHSNLLLWNLPWAALGFPIPLVVYSAFWLHLPRSEIPTFRAFPLWFPCLFPVWNHLQCISEQRPLLMSLSSRYPKAQRTQISLSPASKTLSCLHFSKFSFSDNISFFYIFCYFLCIWAQTLIPICHSPIFPGWCSWASGSFTASYVGPFPSQTNVG